MQKLICTLLLLNSLGYVFGQEYDDYIGAGHDINVTVTSSDFTANGQNTVNAEGLDLDIQGSSKFLSHATLGATIEEIQEVSQIGIEAWIANQMELPVSNYASPTVAIIFELYEDCMNTLGDQCELEFDINTLMWRYAWWHNTMRTPDKLRHRVSLALSEIIVLSDRSELVSYPHGLAAYYDILASNAFGNYRDILTDVTYNPSMGFYLTHINNPKAIPAQNIKPDENYAREIMQLFTIGLYELNQDGSIKIDPTTNKWIPTYDNEDIAGLAKVFTGLSGSKWADEDNTSPVTFGRRFAAYSLLDPMKIYPFWHDQSAKTIVGGYTIPAGQSGDQDISDALDHLFNHPNVGPFLAKRMIQRLIKSNPTPEYISRVAGIFNDNGEGVRGDMKSFVNAILTDEEALDCFWGNHISTGQLRPPTERLTQLMIGLKAETRSEEFWNSAGFYNQLTQHHPLSSPTVFNHYRPDYVPDSEFSYLNFEGPEYQILNSSTSSNYVNYMLLAIMGEYLNDRFTLPPNRAIPNVLNDAYDIPYKQNTDQYTARLNDSKWLDLSFNPEEMIDYLDIVLANGNLSDKTRKDILESVQRRDIFDEVSSAYYAAFLVMIHPDYLIKK